MNLKNKQKSDLRRKEGKPSFDSKLTIDESTWEKYSESCSWLKKMLRDIEKDKLSFS